MRSITLTSSMLLALTTVVGAQTTPVGPGTGGGTQGPTRRAGDLDLPMAPARVDDPDAFAPPIEEEEDDDPRDTDPPVIYGEEIDSESDSIVYVIDQSCSMGWDPQPYVTADGSTSYGSRMDRAKAELTRSITGLSDNFEFDVVSYDCGTRQWASELQEANDVNKQSAIGWVHSLQPGGATGTGPATAQGLSFKENLAVVLLTDGAPNCGATGTSGHLQVIRYANTQGASIDVFGIAASGSYRAFCQSVARENHGDYFDVP